jgi:acyl-coenzyme A thioesterase PaaI-like protein
MSLIDRIDTNPLLFAQLLGIEFISAEADALAARMLIRPELIGTPMHIVGVRGGKTSVIAQVGG